MSQLPFLAAALNAMRARMGVLWPLALALLVVMTSAGRWVESVRTTERITRSLIEAEREVGSLERTIGGGEDRAPDRFEQTVAGFAAGEEGAKALLNDLLKLGANAGWIMTPVFGREESMTADGMRIERIPVELECVSRPRGADDTDGATERWIGLSEAILEGFPSIQIQRLVMSGEGRGLRKCHMSLLFWVRLWEP